MTYEYWINYITCLLVQCRPQDPITECVEAIAETFRNELQKEYIKGYRQGKSELEGKF